MEKTEKKIDVSIVWNNSNGEVFTFFVHLAYLVSRSNVHIFRYDYNGIYHDVYRAMDMLETR